MARLIFVLGHPGTGKTSSLRNMGKEEVGYVTVTGKELPFKSNINPTVAKEMKDVQKIVENAKKPIVIIDDVNYLFSREVFGASEKDDKWDVYDRISKEFFKIIITIINKKTDQNFYLFGHLEGIDSNKVMLKTMGQATRKDNPEGWTNVVLEAIVDLDDFVFKVKTDGTGIKTPIDMFEDKTIPNDLKLVNDAIDTYYGKK